MNGAETPGQLPEADERAIFGTHEQGWRDGDQLAKPTIYGPKRRVAKARALGCRGVVLLD